MVTAQEIPAGPTSEAVISASITAGNAPCLIYNTSPAAVPNFQAQGGLVPLDDFADGASYLARRAPARPADQYKSPDGKFYQMPWKSNPVMLFYNKKAFKKAGIEHHRSPARAPTPSSSTRPRRWSASERGQVRHLAVAVEPVLPVVVRLLPDVRGREWRQAARRGQEGHLRLATPARRSPVSGSRCTRRTWPARRPTTVTRSPTAPRPWPASARGRSRSTRTRSTGASCRCRRRPARRDDQPTFSDAKNVAVYTACTNRGTAWDFLKFSTSSEQDGKLLEMTGQMPLRQNLTSRVRRPTSPPTRSTRRSRPRRRT